MTPWQVEGRDDLNLEGGGGAALRQHPMRLHHDATGRAHVGAEVMMQHRRDLPLAQERKIVGVEIVADEHPARPPRRRETPRRTARFPPPIE